LNRAANRAGYCGLDFGTSNSTVGTGGFTAIAVVRRLILQRVSNAHSVKATCSAASDWDWRSTPSAASAASEPKFSVYKE